MGLAVSVGLGAAVGGAAVGAGVGAGAHAAIAIASPTKAQITNDLLVFILIFSFGSTLINL